MYANGNPISLPGDATGYDVIDDYWENKQVDVCETSSLLFESLKVFNTNCYGFVINCWPYKNSGGCAPGMFVGEAISGINGEYFSCTEVANRVKKRH